MKKEKKIALITLLVMILNMFSPYSILFNNISKAATGVLGENPIIINNLGVTKKGSNKILTVEIAAVTEAILNGFDFQFKIDKSKITPCNKNTGASTTSLGMIMAQSDYFLGTLQVKNYDKNSNTFHFLATEPSGGTDIADNGYIPGQVGDDAIDVNGQGYSVYYPILKLSFKLDSSVDADKLPSDLFSLVPSGVGLPTGLKVNYTNESGVKISKDLPLATHGFTQAEKQIVSIAVKTNPTKTAYDHGDTIDLTGGVIQVTYDDHTTEDIDMTDPAVTIKTGSPADVNNPNVKLEYKGQETTFNITVNDPIQSLSVATPMTQGEYDHGDTLNFAGLTLSAVTKSGATKTITNTTPGLAISETQADVNSPNFTKITGTSNVEVKGTQIIKFTYDGKTAQQTIIVNDRISSVNIVTQPNKTAIKYGEALDLTGATVKITLASGDTTNISLPDGSATISAFNNKQIGSKQKLTVTINNKTAPETIDVEAYNYVKETTLTEPTKVDYAYNEALDVTGGRIKVTWANGTVSNVNLTTNMVTGYNPTQLGVQTLTITNTFKYTLSDGTQIPDTKTMTYEVEVTNPATAITITPPTKTEYEHGDTLDFTGGKIEVTYSDGTTQTKQITSNMVKESNGSSVNMAPTASDYVNNEVSKTLVIKYKENNVTGTVNYPIKIKNVVSQIAMSTEPTNTTYNIGDTTYNLAGGTIKVTRKAGNTETVALTDQGIKLTNLSTLTTNKGTKPVTVTYEGKTTTFNITVKNGVKNINITAPTKTEYEHGDTLDFTGGKIEVKYADSTTSNVQITNAMVTDNATGTAVNMSPAVAEYTNNKLTKTLKIEYTEDGVTEYAYYTITIKNPIDQITIDTQPRTQYNLNDSTTGVGGTLKITRKAGNTETVNIQDSMVSGLTTTTAGTGKTATVTYTDDGVTKTTTYTYNVKDNITNIAITPPTKSQYNHGDALDLAGGKITITYASGTTQDKPLDASMITESNGSPVNMSPASYGNTNKESKTLLIKYQEDGISKQENYPIEIINDVKQIAIQGTAQSQYNVNDPLQTGLSILVTRASGVPEAITVTSNMLTNFSTTTEGTRTATITYTENGITKTTTFTYTVTDTVTSISVKTQPTNDTKYGENADLTGATIDVVKGSGTTTIPVTNDMIQQGTYNPTTLGSQQVTIQYGGQQTTLTINVKDYVTGITINPASVTGKYNDTLSKMIQTNNIQYTVTYAKAGAQTPVTLAESMVAGYSATSTQDQNLTVTYKDTDTDSYTNGQKFTANLKVTLSKEVSSIAITAPSKTTYEHGETIATDGTITVVFTDGTQEQRTMTAGMITENDGSPLNMSPAASEYTNNKINKTLKITYTEDGKVGTINYPIEIINKVQTITIKGTPKTTYNVNEALDNNITITIHRQTGADEDVTVTTSMIPSFDTTTETSETPRSSDIEYTENGTTVKVPYTYTVTDTVSSINVNTQPTKATKYGEDVDLTGVTIDVVKGSGTTTIPVTKDMIKPGTYNPNQTGNQTIKVIYGGKETSLTITVKDYVTGITINPASVTGKYNDTLSKMIQTNNIQYTVTYAKAGAQTPVTLAESMVAGYSATSTQDQNLTVTYKDTDTDSYTNGQNFTANLKVTLSKEVKEINITAPSKTTYEHGETIATDGTITVVFTDGTQEQRTMTAGMITENDGSPLNMSPAASEYTNNKINKTLKITYTEDGKVGTINYPIEIINKVQTITIKGTPKTTYNVNEALDNNITITIHRQTGADEDVTVTTSMIPSFDTTTETSETPRSSDIEYTENGTTVKVPYTYTVTDTVSSINVNTQPTKATKYGEDVDLTGVTIDVVKGSGTKTIPVTKDMIKPGTYNQTTLGSQQVTIQYGGQQTTLTINVKDYVTGITINPASVTGKYNDTLSKMIQTNNIQYTVTYAKAGAQTPVTLAESMVAGYSATSTQDQNLTVTYKDTDTDSYTNGQNFTANLKVTLADTITGMTLQQTGAVKTNYKYNEEFDATNLVIVVHKLSGDVTVPVTKDMIKNYNKQQLGNQTVSVEYNGTTVGTINATVKDYIASVVITAPSKITYKYNEELDLSDAKITITMASKPNAPTTISVTPSMISGYNKAQVGAQTITITYTDSENKVHKQTFGVTVKDAIKTITLENNNFKTNYKYGENLNLSGLSLKVTKESGATTTVPVTSGMISGYNPNKLGNQTLTINHEGKQFTTVVNVVDYVKDITLTPPTKNEYKIGETLNLVGGSITEKMASGANGSTKALTNNMVSGFNSTTPGTKNLTVKYVKDGKTYTKTFQVAVINTINHIEVIAPTKTNYKYGENLNLAGGTIKIHMEDGTIKTVPLTDKMVTGYDKTKPGQQMLKVTYTSEDNKKYEGYFKVTVGEDYIKDTKFVAPTKKQYRIGDTIDLAGGSITEVYASGKLGNKYELTNSMISGFDSTTPGTKQITVTFNNKTYKYNVTVKDKTLGISIKTLPNKLEYKKGENIDLTGATLNVVKESGTTTIKITANMVSGYDKNKTGMQVITVTYEGFTAQFSVLVKEEVQTNPEKPDDNKPNTPDNNKPNTDDNKQNTTDNNKTNTTDKNNNSTSNTTPSVPSTTNRNTTNISNETTTEENKNETTEETTNEENKNEETKQEEDNKNTQDENKVPLVPGTNDNNNNKTPKDKGTISIQGLLNILGLLLALLALAFIIIVLAKRRNNVKIYIEEGDEKVLVGKEKVTKDNRELDLNKYYNKYKEDEYKIVLSKSISKKLDKKTVNLTVHDKKESFVVDYDSKEYIYRT